MTPPFHRKASRIWATSSFEPEYMAFPFVARTARCPSGIGPTRWNGGIKWICSHKAVSGKGFPFTCDLILYALHAFHRAQSTFDQVFTCKRFDSVHNHS